MATWEARDETVHGSIMGRLWQVNRVRFTILTRGQMLETGENASGRGVQLVFASALGGGLYTPAESDIKPTKAPGGEAAKEF